MAVNQSVTRRDSLKLCYGHQFQYVALRFSRYSWITWFMACIFTHTKHVVPESASRESNGDERFSACLLRHATNIRHVSSFGNRTCLTSIKLHPAPYLRIGDCACAQWIWGRKLIIITISKSWMKRRNLQSHFELEIVSKSVNHQHFPKQPPPFEWREERNFWFPADV